MGSIALTVLTLTLGLFFVFVGQFKLTPKFFPDVHEDMRREFGRVNKVFPFYQQTGWRPYAKNFRVAVGLVEVIGGAILVLIPGRLKQVANVALLVTMLGAVYTHYVLHDKFERMAPGLIFSLLLLTRLIIHRQVTQREQSQVKNKNKVPKVENDKSNEKNIEQESDDQQSQSENDDDDDDDDDNKQKPKEDKKKQKKKNK